MAEYKKALDEVSSQYFTKLLNQSDSERKIHLPSYYPYIDSDNQLHPIRAETTDRVKFKNIHGQKVRINPGEKVFFKTEPGKTSVGTLFATDFEAVEKQSA